MNVVPITQDMTQNDTSTEQLSFDDFWLLYPRREAKKDTKKAWAQLSPSQQIEACVAMMDWRRVFMARESERYIPLAASWLRGERWEDELPAEFRRPAQIEKASDDFKQKYSGERTPMPDKLRALLATLRK